MPHSALLITKAIVAAGIFITLVVLTHHYLGWHTLIDAWSKVSLTAVCLVCACIMASHVLRGIRVYIAYRRGFEVKLTNVIGVSLLHNTISFMLPMRLGEAALPLLSKHQLDIDLRYSTSTLILLRIFDAHILLLLLLCFGLNAYLGDASKWIFWLTALSTPIMLSALIHWLKKRASFRSISPLVSRLRTLIILYGMTAAHWVLKLTALTGLAQLLGSLDFSHAWVSIIAAETSVLSPITGFANAGTFQAAFSVPLLPLGYDADSLLSAAINIHILIIVTNVAAGALGAAMLMFKHPIKQV